MDMGLIGLGWHGFDGFCFAGSWWKGWVQLLLRFWSLLDLDWRLVGGFNGFTSRLNFEAMMVVPMVGFGWFCWLIFYVWWFLVILGSGWSWFGLASFGGLLWFLAMLWWWFVGFGIGFLAGSQWFAVWMVVGLGVLLSLWWWVLVFF